MQRHAFPALGTEVEVLIWTDAQDDAVQPALVSVEQWFRQAERRLSRFDPASEVSRLNRQPGVWQTVSQATAHVLRLARWAQRSSGGLFHPGLGGVLAQLGYQRSFAQLTAPVTPGTEVYAAQSSVEATPRQTGSGSGPSVPAEPFQVSTYRCQACVTPGAQVDLGGIGKGWIVEQAALALQAQGWANFVVNAGGDLVCSGQCGERPWQVGIADPAPPHADVLTLTVSSLAVATSGIYKRRWVHAGREVHHVLDPRTGRPADTDVMSCTVLHERLVAAEMMAKAALILGSTAGVAWLQARHTRGWVVITQQGEVLHAWQTASSPLAGP
ncbi:MAG: FAD:protein FMN transferase [Alicyclobacillus sp.]|nr:FAD:protein FMN transferase [Alicyclobacillus sp.]